MGFLQLPTGLRRQIYQQAGLPARRRVQFSRSERAKLVSRAWRLEPHRHVDFATYCSLRLVCRMVTAEILDVFFSTNRFYATGDDLPVLCLLPARAWSSIQHLCLTLDAKADQAPGWSHAAAIFGPKISPDCLRLSLACDACDDATADLVVDALLSNLPRLCSCEIRLGSSGHDSSRYEGSLGRKARKAALQAMGRWPEPRRTFNSFMSLQTELMLKILEYTDLVTPLNRVTWNKREGYALDRASCYAVPNNGPPYDEACHPEAHPTCSTPKICNKCSHLFPSPFHSRAEPGCFRCVHWACQFLDCRGKVEEWPHISPSFCIRRYAAYTPNCMCWMPPTALFLVSRAFTDLARHVFLSQNKFKIQDPNVFFTKVVPESTMPSLRRIEIELDYDDKNKHNDDIQTGRWCKTVERLLRLKLLVPHDVQLDLTFEDNLPSWPDAPSPDDIGRMLPIYRDQRGLHIVRKTIDMVWPIGVSHHLRRLKANLLLGFGADANISYWIHDKRHPFPYRDSFIAGDFVHDDEAFYQHNFWRAQTEEEPANDQFLSNGTQHEWAEEVAACVY